MDVTPPAYNAADIKPDENSKVVNIRKNGDVVFENQVVTMPELVQRLTALRDSGRKYSFYLRADADLRYGAVIDVLRSVKNAGFNDLSLITSAEE